MNTNDKALTPAQEVRDLWTTDQMNLIRQTIAPGISLSELHLFAMICKRTGLDPFTKQIYAIKRKDRMTVQTGIDGYRLLAVRTGELAGIDDALYDSEDGDHPGRATVTVWRLVQGHRVAFTATARWSEYKPDPPSDRMWNKMPYLMLAKCAESLALRKAFPAELSGIYTAEEMAQADPAESASPTLPVEPTSPAQPVTAHELPEVTRMRVVDVVAKHLEEAAVAPVPAEMAEAARQAAAATKDAKEPFKTATLQQWDTMRKLCAQLRRSEPEPPISFEEAGALIGKLSGEYKQLVAARQMRQGQGVTR